LLDSHSAGATLSGFAALGSSGRSLGGRFLADGLLGNLLATSNNGIDSSGALATSLSSGLLGGSLLALDNAGTLSSLLLLRFSTEGDDLGVSFLELPFTAGVGEDTLLNLALSSSDGGHLDLLGGSGGADLGVTEGLDGGLELVISVEVGGVAGWVKGLLELELGLEGVDDESALNTSVGGEALLAVDLAELKSPLGDNNNLAFEVENVDLREFALVLLDGSISEVGGHVEERVRDEEVWLGLLDEHLKILLEHSLGESTVVSTILDHLGVKSLESGSGHL